MKMYRVGLLAFTLTSIAALAAANAADMYRAPEPVMGGYKDAPWMPAWSGFYIGVNGGGAWSVDNDKFAKPANAFGGISPSGGFGGGQIGYNWQSSHFVLGVEADLQGASVEDKATDFLGTVAKSRLDFFGTVRGRLG